MTCAANEAFLSRCAPEMKRVAETAAGQMKSPAELSPVAGAPLISGEIGE
jgi:hypothetical protein